jgi:hypothetical protein
MRRARPLVLTTTYNSNQAVGGGEVAAPQPLLRKFVLKSGEKRLNGHRIAVPRGGRPTWGERLE